MDVYELRDIPAGAPEARSVTRPDAEPYLAAIYRGARWVFRFKREGLRGMAAGPSYAEVILRRLNL